MNRILIMYSKKEKRLIAQIQTWIKVTRSHLSKPKPDKYRGR